MSSSNRKAALKKLKTLIFTPKSEINNYRSIIEKTFKTTFLPNHVEKSERSYSGISCDFLSPELYSTKRIMFYIHGGCFVGGSRASYRNFCATLANKAYSRTVVPEYRLAPAHPFPAAIEDVQAAFRSLFTEEQIARSLDSSAQNQISTLQDSNETSSQPEFIIAADGAGASIAMALLLNLRERYRKCIKKVVFFSPWFDISDSSSVFTNSNKKSFDEMINSDIFKKCRDVYTYSSNFENPLISPIYAAKDLLENFPPVYIQMGEKELLLEDAKKMAKLFQESGISCSLDTWPNMMHLFQIADEFLEDSHSALQKFSVEISGMEEKSERQTFQNKPKLENSLTSEA